MKRYKMQITRELLLAVFLISGMVLLGAADGLTSYIDDHNRLILNGDPFFPLGLFVFQPPSSGEGLWGELDEIANSPFDTLMNYSSYDGTPSQITDYLDQLETRNLNLIFSLFVERCDAGNTVCEIQNPFPTISAFEDFIEQNVTAFRSHPAVITWYLNDEMCPVCLDYLEAGYEKIKELDSNHPVWSVHWNPDWLIEEAHTTDIVGVDFSVNDAWLADAANTTGKPLWVVSHIRTATEAEMRAMTYLAINHGAKGLIYYSYSASDPTGWSEIKGVASEADQLRPVFLSTQHTTDNDVTCNNGNIDYKLMKNGDVYYLFAVNTNNEALNEVPFQINLNEKPSTVETLFEGGRQVDVINGNFTDDFGAYEVHVYLWEEPEPVTVNGSGGGGGGCFIGIISSFLG